MNVRLACSSSLWATAARISGLKQKKVGMFQEGYVHCTLGSSDFDIFLEIQYASCVFGLALKF